MGKKKAGGKKPSVFKVAGAKSLKAKSRAKPVTGNLKKINEIVRKSVSEIDKNLVQLENDLRQKKEGKVKSKSLQVGKRAINDRKAAEELEKEKQITLEKLSDMQF